MEEASKKPSGGTRARSPMIYTPRMILFSTMHWNKQDFDKKFDARAPNSPTGDV
jgi:hypothetical protein